MSKIRLGLALLALLLGGAFVSVTPAFADLRVCNQTADPVSIALGYRAERGWQSEGWWVAAPSQCATVYQGNLNSRFFYLFAADDIGGGAWDGNVYMCTRDDSFTIFGIEDCLARGYERTGFFEVDTQNKSDWTLQLTDPAANANNANGTDADGPPDQPQPGDVPESTAPDDGGNPNPDASAPSGIDTE
ncbi:MAG TPA: DUF1036 domain-containing protein [Devosiaceae bacterium]|nr:DUF1036 domain-containing protein [Devosiaceae bacterium]